MTALHIAADHPAFAGHFPGSPVVPAVVLLDAALQAVEQAFDRPARGWRIAAAKFPSPVKPGEPLRLEHQGLPNGAVRCEIWTGERAVANGLLVPKPPTGNARGDES
jgi:3-hydroxymyristoyl/3-hydroxydecanoyl-(acyl carrier protein) dehydratase